MTLSPNSQPEIEVYLHIPAIMLEIKKLTSYDNYKLAEILGVRYETIIRAGKGKTGSAQLLCGLKLLLELETLKRKPVLPVEVQLEEMRSRIKQLEEAEKNRLITEKPAELALNDADQVSSPTAEEVLAERREAALRSARSAPDPEEETPAASKAQKPSSP